MGAINGYSGVAVRCDGCPVVFRTRRDKGPTAAKRCAACRTLRKLSNIRRFKGELESLKCNTCGTTYAAIEERRDGQCGACIAQSFEGYPGTCALCRCDGKLYNISFSICWPCVTDPDRRSRVILALSGLVSMRHEKEAREIGWTQRDYDARLRAFLERIGASADVIDLKMREHTEEIAKVRATANPESPVAPQKGGEGTGGEPEPVAAEPPALQLTLDAMNPNRVNMYRNGEKYGEASLDHVRRWAEGKFGPMTRPYIRDPEMWAAFLQTINTGDNQ